MQMTMIEQVAKSIDQTIRDNTGEHVNDELLKRLARAVIEAMHEPTEKMHIAGLKHSSSQLGNIAEPYSIYQTMIDAALKE